MIYLHIVCVTSFTFGKQNNFHNFRVNLIQTYTINPEQKVLTSLVNAAGALKGLAQRGHRPTAYDWPCQVAKRVANVPRPRPAECVMIRDHQREYQ